MRQSKKEILHTVSVEKLHHFRCGVCDKWWSIGDPHISDKKYKELFCPWCGIKKVTSPPVR